MRSPQRSIVEMARRSREDTEHLEARADTEELEPGNATSHSGENLDENGEGPRDPYLSVNSNSTQCETVADALNALGHTCDVEVAADGSDNLRRKGRQRMKIIRAGCLMLWGHPKEWKLHLSLMLVGLISPAAMLRELARLERQVEDQMALMLPPKRTKR